LKQEIGSRAQIQDGRLDQTDIQGTRVATLRQDLPFDSGILAYFVKLSRFPTKLKCPFLFPSEI
jgi:hypothetical protein